MKNHYERNMKKGLIKGKENSNLSLKHGKDHLIQQLNLKVKELDELKQEFSRMKQSYERLESYERL